MLREARLLGIEALLVPRLLDKACLAVDPPERPDASLLLEPVASELVGPHRAAQLLLLVPVAHASPYPVLMRLVLGHAVAQPAREGGAGHLHGSEGLPPLRHLAHGGGAHGGHAVHRLPVHAPGDPAHVGLHVVPHGILARPLGEVALRREVVFAPMGLNLDLKALHVEARGPARCVPGPVAGLVDDEQAACAPVVRHVARLALGVEVGGHHHGILGGPLVDLEGPVVRHLDLLHLGRELEGGVHRPPHDVGEDPLADLRGARVGDGEGVADGDVALDAEQDVPARGSDGEEGRALGEARVAVVHVALDAHHIAANGPRGAIVPVVVLRARGLVHGLHRLLGQHARLAREGRD
mmetsp:Transcript_93/g.207  ORF Transcript_93/g.207 Transcript_93/m.207 type:complete len:353 (-) Transcript_93:472-1530(-)